MAQAPPTPKEKWIQSLFLPEDSESPVVWNHGAPEDDNDEFEGFVSPGILRLEVDKSVKDPVVKTFFTGYRVTIRQLKEEQESKVLEIKFRTSALAQEALKRFRSGVLNDKPVLLTHFLKSRHIAYLVSGFRRAFQIPVVENILTEKFKKYGRVLKVFFPEDKNLGLCYVYLYVKANLPYKRYDNPENVQLPKLGGKATDFEKCDLKVTVTHMKASVSRKFARELAIEED